MIKVAAILIFGMIWVGLNRYKKRRYPESDNKKINLFKRFFYVPILGVLFGILGAIDIACLPDFDKNLDIWFIVCLFTSTLVDETVNFCILEGKFEWFLSK